MKSILNFLRIHREERLSVGLFFLLQVILNGLLIAYYFKPFTALSKDYRNLFVKTYCLSGYDPLTYVVVSDWNPAYEVNRHPLLAFFYYPAYLLNYGLIQLFGINFAQFIVAIVLIFSAVYGFVLMLRILRELIGLPLKDAALLSLMLYSFAHVMIASVAPDHFILSLFALLLTIYVAGKQLKTKVEMKKWQAILLFILTGGISLNNGLKVFIANFFTRGKRFFNIWNLLFVVLIPSATVWYIGEWQYKNYSVKRYQAKREMQNRYVAWEKKQKLQTFRDTTSIKDTALQTQAFEQQWQKYRKDVRTALHKKPAFAHTGKPVSEKRFLKWTDISTPRSITIVENLFGESLQLHQKHLLQDVLTSRPVIVTYDWALNYIVEGILVLFFIVGVWCARRSKLFWLVASFAAMDMLLHIGLGFGINEVYIMTCHWVYIIPIALAFLLRSLHGKYQQGLRLVLAALTAFLLIYNISLLMQYLYF